mmetsp:Transcript_19856/g.24331  ORF Transcript_19856/g.24331 Transcript_19856/m.24331 type:complete len:203 (+) Transcript_19856:628-1236(+)
MHLQFHRNHPLHVHNFSTIFEIRGEGGEIVHPAFEINAVQIPFPLELVEGSRDQPAILRRTGDTPRIIPSVHNPRDQPLRLPQPITRVSPTMTILSLKAAHLPDVILPRVVHHEIRVLLFDVILVVGFIVLRWKIGGVKGRYFGIGQNVFVGDALYAEAGVFEGWDGRPAWWAGFFEGGSLSSIGRAVRALALGGERIRTEQ